MTHAVELVETLARLPQAIFAVVDGARLPDAPARLAGINLRPRALYLEGADPDAARNGPQLVALDSRYAAERLIALIDGAPAAVFWSWSQGIDSLYRHLRVLNVAQVARVDVPAAPEDYETVLFRHADPDVLGLMWAVMDQEQRRTLLGASPGIAFHSPKIGAVWTLQ